MRLRLDADGRRLVDAAGTVVAMCDDPEVATHLAHATNSVDDIAADLEELLVACGLDYARTWGPHEAFAEVIRQVRQVRKTIAGAPLTGTGRV